MSDPVFGISITRIDNEPRPAVWSDMAVVGIIGTAPSADADVFPLNTPVFMYSDDRTKALGLGSTGTVADAINLINAQCRATIKVRHVVNQGETAPGWTAEGRA